MKLTFTFAERDGRMIMEYTAVYSVALQVKQKVPGLRAVDADAVDHGGGKALQR